MGGASGERGGKGSARGGTHQGGSEDEENAILGAESWLSE